MSLRHSSNGQSVGDGALLGTACTILLLLATVSIVLTTYSTTTGRLWARHLLRIGYTQGCLRGLFAIPLSTQPRRPGSGCPGAGACLLGDGNEVPEAASQAVPRR
jgi:hypothetical protein